jgi:raffinose/stachyose/melibiose transport system permease protein
LNAHGRRDVLLFVGPAAIVVLGLYVAPLVINVVLSLFNWTAFRPSLSWTGLGNYQQLDSQNLLIPTTIRTLIYALVTAVLLVIGPLCLALALERNSHTNRLLRTAFFAPVLLSPLAVGFVFRSLLGLDGTVNGILSALLGQTVSVPWLASPDFSLFVVAFGVAWRWFPLVFVVFVAGLATIPRELIEAAWIDGAGGWSLLRHIKLPLLGPAITFSVVIAFITALSVYETVFVLTGGGPGRSTQILNFLVIIEFGQGRFGSSAALSTVLYGAILLCCFPLVAMLRRREVQL